MPSRYYRLNTDDLVFARNSLDYRQGQREEGAIALHQLLQQLKNITLIRPRANLSLVSKAVGVADGELIKNRLGTSKLLYFQCISGK
ncbi:hypothetical protein N0Y54_41175 [Nostoc punctiforme UO1]|uniref:hypothetical protein n=1 Tax=Nostoc punctiforme TaxID=272131 RepID=UPI0030AE7940